MYEREETLSSRNDTCPWLERYKSQYFYKERDASGVIRTFRKGTEWLQKRNRVRSVGSTGRVEQMRNQKRGDVGSSLWKRHRAQTAKRVVVKYLDRKARAPLANRRSHSGVGGV